MAEMLCCAIEGTRCASCAYRQQLRQQLDAEEAALKTMDRIAQTIVDELGGFSHWGGDEPFDGILDGVARRVAFLNGGGS